MFSERTLNDIRSRSDIVEVVGRYVQLKKSGQGYQGLCPFHSEKTPSFHVHPAKQVYRCFGSCAKGGNVFTFLMELENLPFPEAVRRLARETGVQIEEDKTAFRKDSPKPTSEASKRIAAALEWASKYFHHLLTTDPQYAFAKKYILGRGLSEKSIEKFRLGVSPRGWNTLIGLMQKRGYQWEDLLGAGLVVPKEDGPTPGYDRFRNRLMFPIFDKEGQVVGFGARALAEDDQPKYLNSPETEMFSKSKVLYGLFENQRDIRVKSEAVIVEGYMDVVGLYEAGVNNAVAPMGTALTPEHCRELKSMVQKIVTVFDPDAAGVGAWHRTIALFMETGLVAKDVTLPPGQDPDDFVQKQGAEAFYKLCDEAPQQVTKYLKEIASKGALGEKERLKYTQELIPILNASRRLPDKGALIWDDTARVLNVSFEALKRLTEQSPYQKQKAEEAAPRQAVPARRPQAPIAGQKKHPLDWEFFKEAIRTPEPFLQLPKDQWRDYLREPRLAELLDVLWDARTPEKFQEVLEQLTHAEEDPAIIAAFTGGLLKDLETPGKQEDLFQPVAKRILDRKTQAEIRSLANQVRLSNRMGDGVEELKLLEKLRDLKSSHVKSSTKPPEPHGH